MGWPRPALISRGGSTRTLDGFSEPLDDLVVDLIRPAKLEMMHPVTCGGVHDLSVGVHQVLAGEPQIGEAVLAAEGDLALRGANLERSEAGQARADPLVNGRCNLMSVE